jgi:hypothetical protein
MSDWNSASDRKEAAWRFLKRLEDNPQLREECLKYPWRAREIFAEEGNFTNFPASVELRLVVNEKASRDNLHILAVPPAGETLGPKDKFDPAQVWLGLWNKWDQ